MMTIKSILFDLDGTILDTIDDLLSALNRLRTELNLPLMSKDAFRPLVSFGSRAMINEGLGINENSKDFKYLRDKLLAYYEEEIATHTQLFPNMGAVLDHLDASNIPWGIVTNKLEKHTHPLLKSLQLHHRPQTIVCGDTLAKAKPHPEPILHALSQLRMSPEHCFYVGDAHTDALASQAAGTPMVVALYGYIQEQGDPKTWPAKHFINDPIDLIALLNQQNQ